MRRTMTFDPSAFLNTLRRRARLRRSTRARPDIASAAAALRALNAPVSPPVERALAAAGTERLYTHQAEAINAALAGQNVVVATSTASGKTLCFNVPVLEALARDPLARALYIYPTKALAQDQLGKWSALVKAAGEGIINPLAATYDGDTPQAARSRIRRSARVLLTNPDMLHAGILPNHPLWAEFFRHLCYVVIDEAHTYRGVFGSQVACVLRRLRRVCGLYQGTGVRDPGAGLSNQLPASSFQFIATSATMANPAEHFELLTGLSARVISDDGSPHGPRTFALWNPPFVDRTKSARRSANGEASDLLYRARGTGYPHDCVHPGARRGGAAVALCARGAAQSVAGPGRTRGGLSGGYLPEERRRIEHELFGGRSGRHRHHRVAKWASTWAGWTRRCWWVIPAPSPTCGSRPDVRAAAKTHRWRC